MFIMFTPAMRLCDIPLADSPCRPNHPRDHVQQCPGNLLGGSGGIQWEETAARILMILFDGERAADSCSMLQYH